MTFAKGVEYFVVGALAPFIAVGFVAGLIAAALFGGFMLALDYLGTL